MTLRTIAVTLKIPDNEALTAQSALKRLGVEASRLERADIWQFEDSGTGNDVAQRFEHNESLYNPNKHVLHVLENARPRAGEVWVETLDATDVPLRMHGAARGRKLIGWRLYVRPKEPAPQDLVRQAAEKLLCNPAIERAIYS